MAQARPFFFWYSAHSHLTRRASFSFLSTGKARITAGGGADTGAGGGSDSAGAGGALVVEVEVEVVVEVVLVPALLVLFMLLLPVSPRAWHRAHCRAQHGDRKRSPSQNPLQSRAWNPA